MSAEKAEIARIPNLENLPPLDGAEAVESFALEKKERAIEKKREDVKQTSVVEREELKAGMQIEIVKTQKSTLDEIAATPITPENSETIQKKLSAVGAAGKQLGIDSLPVKVDPILEKSFQRVVQNPDATVEFDLVSGDLLVEGMSRVEENYLAMVALDAAFANEILDEDLAQIDREDVVELVKIFDPENGGELTPRALRGFAALAKLSNYNFAELKSHGIFDENLRLNKYAARRFAATNRGELRETSAITVANLKWGEKNPEIKRESSDFLAS